MSKRFQECNWLVKLWRYRHYAYIPFRFISYRIRSGGDFEELRNSKTLWGVLVGYAQCDMNWTYSSEEVMKRLFDKYKDE